MAYRAIFSRGSAAAGAAGASVASIPAAAECRAANRGQHPTSVQNHHKASRLVHNFDSFLLQGYYSLVCGLSIVRRWQNSQCLFHS